MDILASTLAYEAFLRDELGREVVEAGLREKRREMAEAAFPFLRATYWRWAETVAQLAPALMQAPVVLAVGDIHLENFGTWRDAEGRLVWGVNDYDEAAEMPYTLDLLRLATSGLLASPGHDAAEAARIAEALLQGYAEGLRQPGAAVLDRKRAWLRQAVMVPEAQREAFWSKLKKTRKKFQALDAAEQPPLWWRYEAALRAALPAGAGDVVMWYREAGLGSLGRPRWVAQAEWCGERVLREAKAIVPSGWTRVHAGRGRAIRCVEIATGRHRAPDPWYRLTDGVAVRRLSPNNRKIGTDKPTGFMAGEGGEASLGRDVLLSPPMLDAMGRELAAIHLGIGDLGEALCQDLEERPAGWLAKAAEHAAFAVRAEQARFCQSVGGVPG